MNKRHIIMSVLALLIPLCTIAQITEIKTLQTGIRQKLEDGVLYRFPQDSLTFDFSKDRNIAPLSVDSGSVAAIELKDGQVLRVYGSDARNVSREPFFQNTAHPGILIPKGATLVIFGKGEVIAIGGNGCEGEVGFNGGSAELSFYDIIPGAGGRGGHGGGGAAPGIGGRGGAGGDVTKATPPDPWYVKLCDLASKSGVAGKDNEFAGGNGGDMGTLIVMGDIKVTATSGAAGALEKRYALRGANDELRKWDLDIILTYLHWAGYGGGGGNGGSGAAARYGIGGGAPGAGGGGAGGAGGSIGRGVSDYNQLHYITGGGGEGGKSSDTKLDGRDGEGIAFTYRDVTPSGGMGGKAGEYGGDGVIYRTGNVSFNCHLAADSVHTITSFDNIPENARALVTRTICGAEWEDGTTELKTFLGQEMPDLDVVIPEDETKGTFRGYRDQFGKMVYDKNGCLALDVKNHSGLFSYHEDTQKWYVASADTIRLTPSWSGLKDLYVVRYIENPDFNGNPADPERYYTSDSIFAEHITIPYDDEDVECKLALYTDATGKKIIDRRYFTYTGAESDSISVKVPGDEDMLLVELNYDIRKFNLAWDIDENIMSRQCTNINDYTLAGQVPYTKTIVFPTFRQAEGREFCSWMYKSEGEYVAFNAEAMPASDITLYAMFKVQTFAATLSTSNGGNALVYVDDSEQHSDSLGFIKYHKDVHVKTVAAADYRLKDVEVVGRRTFTNTEYTITADVVTFRMPDEDVDVRVTFEYHPFRTLSACKAADDGATPDSIVYYVTKDNKTYYTDDNNYYKFKDEVYGGAVSKMQCGIGDVLNIVTDFKGDDGSRLPRAFIISKDEEGYNFYELERMQLGLADSTCVYFTFQVDSVHTQGDLQLQLQWSAPRTRFHINYTESDIAKVSDIYANGRDIFNTNVAYAGEQINFRVKRFTEDFDFENISLTYEDGYQQNVLDAGVGYTSPTDTIYTFMMPESDIDMRFLSGNKYNIYTETYPGVCLIAPMKAVAGYPVYCVMQYDTDITEMPDEQDIHLFVNGRDTASDESYIPSHALSYRMTEDVDMPASLSKTTKTFIMPEKDVYLSLGKDVSPTGLRFIEQDAQYRRSAADGIYNLMGQKQSAVDNLPGGIYVVNGQKYLSRKH